MKGFMPSPSCVIVGGGPSLKGFNFSSLSSVNTIVVNQAIFDVPSPETFITMDYLFVRNNPHLFDIHTHKVFIVNHCVDYIKDFGESVQDTRNGAVYNLSRFDEVINSWYAHGLGKFTSEFVHGANSGYCALQYALLQGYREINLLGFDLVVDGDSTHYHKRYGKHPKFAERLPGYLEDFKVGICQILETFPDIKVYSCSKISALNQYLPYRDIEEVLKSA